MSSSNHPADPNKLPVKYQPDGAKVPDVVHHTREWTSGTRGGGSVPKEFEWPSNPKQHQEEHGSPGVTK